MKQQLKILLAFSLTLSLGVSSANAETKESLTRDEIMAKISYHQKLESQYRQANQFLSIKHPLSFGNPDLHRRKIEELRRLLDGAK